MYKCLYSFSFCLEQAYQLQVNCRRAASAAFQELVGRLESLDKGLEIVTIADYFSLGPRSKAYLDVATKIATMDMYRNSLLDHVYKV